MRRRDVIGLLGGAAAWPVAALAQERRRMPMLGVLLYSSPDDDPNVQSLRRALTELGYIDGHTIRVAYRYAERRGERLPELAAALVELRPDVIFMIGGDVAELALGVTRPIPTVFSTSTDPVRSGLVSSLSHPGGHATGVTFVQDALAPKRLQILKEAAPQISRVALLWNPDHIDNEPSSARIAAQRLNLHLEPLAVRRPGEFDGALREAMSARADALYAVSSRMMLSNLSGITTFATERRLPLAGGWGAWAQSGALLSYGPQVDLMIRRAVAYVDRILKGAHPSDLPVQQPSKFDLVINLRTARTLGLTIPRSLLAHADQVVG